MLVVYTGCWYHFLVIFVVDCSLVQYSLHLISSVNVWPSVPCVTRHSLCFFDYKISSSCYDVSDAAPLYLSDLLCLYVPSRSLRSSADTHIFRIPRRKKKFQGQRAFSHLGPVTWNKLPYSVRHAQTQFQFKTQLKTTLFRSVCEPDS